MPDNSEQLGKWVVFRITFNEILAFSSSQLRDHSCWFFAPTCDLTAEDIRDWMGEFHILEVLQNMLLVWGNVFSTCE